VKHWEVRPWTVVIGGESETNLAPAKGED